MRSRRCWSAVAVAVAALAACGGDDGGFATSPSREGSSGHEAPQPDSETAGASTELADGPVTLVALGDSLTAGEGDDSGAGYVGRLTDAISSAPGRADSTSFNFGVSGWDSTMMVDGQDGTDGQLAPAVAQVEAVAAEGGAVIATVLIGSNDMWFVYGYTTEDTDAAAEDAAVEVYRGNLERTVTELQAAGAIVLLGLPDEQSQRPFVVDLERLQGYFPDFSAGEVDQMAALAGRLGEVVEEVAAEHGALTVDTNDPFWADPSMMADDGGHPNGDGYAVLADLFYAAIEPLL